MQLVDMSILSILLSLGPGCHILTPLRDRRPRRSIPSQERPLLATSRKTSASSPCATSVRPVPAVLVPRPCIQCQLRIPDAHALTRHVLVHMSVASAPPRARAHASTLTPVRAREPRESAFIPLCNSRFIKGHKPSNHIRARIKSHVYTIE